MDIISLLTHFDLTKQEATIYTVLLQSDKLTGYEITKETGISRSNVYTALKSLVDKGAANIVEEKSTKYLALPIHEFCSNKIGKLNDLKDILVNNIPEKKHDTTGYITIVGDENIINKIKNMINNAKERIYLSMSKEYISLFEKDIKKAIKKQLKVVIITDEEVLLDNAQIYISQEKQNQIRLITDSQNVLTGELSDANNFDITKVYNKNSSCLYSNKINLTKLFKESLQNEIRLIELKK